MDRRIGAKEAYFSVRYLLIKSRLKTKIPPDLLISCLNLLNGYCGQPVCGSPLNTRSAVL